MNLLKIFLLTCSHMSIYSCDYSTSHYLHSQAEFHGILWEKFQVSVNHIMQQKIQHTLIVNFMLPKFELLEAVN